MKLYPAVFILFMGFLSACSPTFYLNSSLTKEPEHIEIREVKALILRNGEIYTENIFMKDSLFFSGLRPIDWHELAALEVKQTRFGDAIAAPLEVIGGASALSGAGLLYLGSVSDDDDEDQSNLEMMGIGFGMVASGFVIYKLGHKLRPSEKKSTRTIYILKQQD